MKLKKIKGYEIVDNKYFPKYYGKPENRDRIYCFPCSVSCDADVCLNCHLSINNLCNKPEQTNKETNCRVAQKIEAKKLGIKLIKIKGKDETTKTKRI